MKDFSYRTPGSEFAMRNFSERYLDESIIDSSLRGILDGNVISVAFRDAQTTSREVDRIGELLSWRDTC